ncbi:MarR family winged helix-turn-helix transcriptional regulator [Advenella kashmirensis]
MDKKPLSPEQARVSELAAELRILISSFTRKLRAQASAGDFTPSQRSVLLRLERDGPTTVTALARAEGVRPQSMGATVSSLDAAGHIQGTPDPTDGRQTILSLTPRFLTMIQASRAAREDWLVREIQSCYNTKEQESLAKAIELLKRLVNH